MTYDVNYADGTFAKSQVMNQFFNLTSNYVSPNERYIVAASFIRNRAYVLENGKIVLSGTGDELANSEMVKKAYLGG